MGSSGITPQEFDEKLRPSRQLLKSPIKAHSQIGNILEHTGRMFFFKTEMGNTQWLVIESTETGMNGPFDKARSCVYITGSEDKLKAIAVQTWEDYKARNNNLDFIPTQNSIKGTEGLINGSTSLANHMHIIIGHENTRRREEKRKKLEEEERRLKQRKPKKTDVAPVKPIFIPWSPDPVGVQKTRLDFRESSDLNAAD